MTGSYSVSLSTTFTATHARHIAAKVSADLKRMQRFYHVPSDAQIANYEAEIAEYLKAGYLDTVTYGFRRDGQWIEPTLRYTAKDLTAADGNDDDPGKVRPNADVLGSSFYNYLTHSASWWALPEHERDAFEQKLPFQRVGAAEPGINGYLVADRRYSSGGRALDRSSLRSF